MTATTTTTGSSLHIATRLFLTGRVQGIGLRPAVARLAETLSLTGFVGNTQEGVEIHVEGAKQKVERFERELHAHLPATADLSSLRKVRVEPAEFATFIVRQACNLPRHSHDDPLRMQTGAMLSAHVPTDVVSCHKCLAEVRDMTDHRNEYAFTSCTDCGPRYTIIEHMPYERAQTSMAAFELCEGCRQENESHSDRRFHAQTNACSKCGPQVWLRDASQRIAAHDRDAVHAAASAIRDQRIVALRGLGGYQLLVDATSQAAVERLRLRKQRRGKPLAVMVASLADAGKHALLDETERQLLCDPAGPIVVAIARSDAHLASAVMAGLNTVGLMLPTSPLHMLLLNACKRPLVCTSGNREGDPLVYKPEAAMQELRGIADVWLEHDRPIRRSIDDSVVRMIAGRPVTIRLARGYAPLPLELQTEGLLVALGGHQKTSIALSNGAQAILGPHLGDMESMATRRRYVERVADLSELYGVDRGLFVCDRHPQYFTTEWAEKQTRGIERVQHHHAHVAACMLEHGWLDRQVIGVAFDGSGYGTDATIWGGEFLLATATTFERVAHLRPFSLAGGERAMRQPWRVATALVREAAGDEQAARLVFHSGDAKSLLPILRRPRLSQMTTSVGRLFDGLAALVLNVEQCQFEGQAAMFLEAACNPSSGGHYDIPIENTSPRQLDWGPLVRQVLRDRAAGISPGAMAMRFHRGLANAIAEVCRCYSSLPVALGGGVFQNRVLVELLAERFDSTNQPLGLPGRIPPNDGGLAAGQIAVAAAMVRQRRTNSCA